MQVVADRVCGLDVHRDTVCACIRVPQEGGARKEIIETFGTMAEDLLGLRDWLKLNEVTQVAMESTGVYWKPIYYLLEEEFKVLLVNAAHVKNVPGRKTDVKDCAWIAQLLEHGLLRGSFVPPQPIRDLRDLTRYRRELVQERVRQVQRLHKFLQDAGIKLSSVATNIMGVSGRKMIEALVEGKADAASISELAQGKLRQKLELLKKALSGRFRVHQAFLVTQILGHIDYLEETVSAATQQIEEQLRPFVKAVDRLKTIPGIDQRTASEIVAEIGVNMKQFPTAQHLASWAGLCPGNNESAGKHKRGPIRKGDKWLKPALVQAALGAIRSRDNYLWAQYTRIVSRAGHKRAIVAVAHSILVRIYYMLSRECNYEELGRDYFTKIDRERIRNRCLRRLKEIGYEVALSETAVA